MYIERKLKKNVSKKNISERLGNCWMLVKKYQNIYKIEKFDSVFSIDKDPIVKENSI